MKYKAIIRTCLLLLFVLGIPFCSQAQAGKKFTISGYIKEASNGEAIIGAAVTIREPLKGTVTNNYGFYSITADSGQYEMAVSFTGLQRFNQHINLSHDIFLDIKMLPIESEVVIITDHKADENVSNGQMSAALAGCAYFLNRQHNIFANEGIGDARLLWRGDSYAGGGRC